MDKTFAEFKTDFYERFDNADIFDCTDFNTIKIVLDGLKANYNQYNLKENYFLKSRFLYNLLLSIKLIFIWKRKYVDVYKTVKKKLSELSSRKYFVGFSTRTIIDENGYKNNLYFSRIVNDLNAHDCIFAGDDSSYQNKKPEFDILKNELMIAQLFVPQSEYDIFLVNQLQKNFTKLSAIGIFTKAELKNIRTAYSFFYQQFRAWNLLFENSSISTAIITVHYHKEGLLYAAKKNGVRIIELQHGLIDEQDIFYVFPEKVQSVVKRALFADYILTYGKSWNKILSKGTEYTEQQVKVLGYYHYKNQSLTNDEKLLDVRIGSNKVALFTTQTFLEQTFIDYINFIKNTIPANYLIVIKPHPRENLSMYTNCFGNCNNIIIANCSLDFLLSKASFNITCYSTTVFDAMRFNVKSMAINFDRCKDYVQSFVEKNVVVKVEPNQNIFDKLSELNKLEVDSDSWYSEYNFESLEYLLK